MAYLPLARPNTGRSNIKPFLTKPMPPIERQRSLLISHKLAVLALVSLFIEYILRVDIAVILLTSALILVCSALTLWRRFDEGLRLLPYIVVTSPIASFALTNAPSINIADFYSGILAVIFLVKYRSNRMLRDRNNHLLFSIVLLGCSSWLLSQEPLTSAIAMIGLFQYLIVYFATLSACNSRKKIEMMLKAWIFPVTLGSALVCYAYYSNEVLAVAATEEYRNYVQTMKRSSEILFRATYFVGFFYHLLGIVLSMSLIYLVYDKRHIIGRKFLSIPLLLINMAALFLSGTKTIMASVAISAAITFTAFGRGGRVGLRKRAVSLALVALSIAGIYWGALLVMGENQLTAFSDRVLSLDSFQMRLNIWGNAMGELFSSFKVFLFGLGPDVTVRSGDTQMLQRIFDTGQSIEGSVDSTYVYILLNYGSVLFILAMIFCLRIFLRITRVMMREPETTSIMALWICMLSFGISAASQILSVSKFGFVVVQLFAMGAALTNEGRPLKLPSGLGERLRPNLQQLDRSP